MMNIFLLFLTTLLMIGYYITYSPSQRLENIETDNVVHLADLKSRAECVIAAQNAGLDSLDFEDDCIVNFLQISDSSEQQSLSGRGKQELDATFPITSRKPYQYICTDANYNVINCNSENVEFNYIVTKSKPLDDVDFAPMLQIIETLYQDKGSLGIYHYDGYLMTGDLSGQRPIADSIADSADLQHGQLVYITQYQIPYFYTYPDNPNSNHPCSNGGIRVERYGRTLCIGGEQSEISCKFGYVYDEENAQCVLLGNECETACAAIGCTSTCICHTDSDTVECVTSNPTTECPTENLIFDEDLQEYVCISEESNSGDAQCSGDDIRFIPTKGGTRSIGQTLQIKNISCATSCLRPARICNPDTGKYEYACLPDPAKMATCSNADEINGCTDENSGIYFGFNNNSGVYATPPAASTYTIQNMDLDDILASAPLHDNKFHCKTCTHGIHSGLSIENMVVTCNKNPK